MEVRIVDTMLVAVTDTVTVGDTVYLSLPQETKVYGDSTYTAQVSGYRPELDWVEVYPQTEVVTRNIFVDSRKRWGIGLQAGYEMLVYKRVTQKSKTDLRVTFLFYNDRKVRRVRVMGWGGDINK